MDLVHKTRLLDSIHTLQKIKRIAYQIYENNFDEKEIILAGINGEGFVFAEMIMVELKKITSILIFTAKLSFDKSAKVQPEINIESEVDTFKNKVIILVDDVLNTGKTLAFCLRPFLSIPLKKIQVAVLVDRGYPKYPIAADYVGYSLSTTITEHVKVILSDKSETGVYLF
jgi:pyrimidine operon attenuation protein / uracil phosphoribosyltransferase